MYQEGAAVNQGAARVYEGAGRNSGVRQICASEQTQDAPPFQMRTQTET